MTKSELVRLTNWRFKMLQRAGGVNPARRSES